MEPHGNGKPVARHQLPPAQRRVAGWWGRWAGAWALSLYLSVAGPFDARGGVEGLRTQLQAQLAETTDPAAAWGVQVMALDSGTVLFETNAHRPFIPASTTKLFTLALAFDRLGGDFRFPTSLRAQQLPEADGALAGPLVVRGHGDPSWGSGTGWTNGRTPMARLAEILVRRGVRRIRGDLICDESYFRSAPYGDGWAWDDLAADYGAALSALTVNDNLIRLHLQPADRVGAPAKFDFEPEPPPGLDWRSRVFTGPTNVRSSLRFDRLPGEGTGWVTGEVPLGGPPAVEEVAVPSPAHYWGDRFRRELVAQGVVLEGKVRVRGWREAAEAELPDGIELGAFHSPALAELAALMMKPSNNLHAQLLWLQVGAHTEAYPSDEEAFWPRLATTTEVSQRAMTNYLAHIGVPAAEVRLEEGAGLSRANLVSPAAMVQVLRVMTTNAWADAWKASLPVGGRDGTLRNRFKTGAAAGNVLAKTGSLRYVATLAGYVNTADGERLAFAILANQYLAGAAKARAEIDRMVQTMAEARVR